MTENNPLHLAKENKRAARDSKTRILPNPEGDNKPRGAAPADPQNEARSPLKKLRGRKRMRLGDAMRKAGLDEHTVAETYVDVVQKLRRNHEPNGSLEKVLADVLKECSRVLEAPRPSNLSGSGDAPTPIHLVHKVPRPERSPKNPQGLSRSADLNMEEAADASGDIRGTAFPDVKSREESR
jgi:hypothetical protein